MAVEIMDKKIEFYRFANLYKILAVILTLFLCIYIVGDDAKAVPYSAGPDLSWTLSSPNASVLDTVSKSLDFTCPYDLKTREIAGDSTSKEVCLYEGDSVSFGIALYGGSSRTLVSFATDKKMHRVYVPCEQYNSCLYLPDTDTLVTKQHLVNSIVWSLVIYKNFSSRLSQHINPSNFVMEYMFDASNPDYIFKNESGNPWAVVGVGASDNGKWLAVEFRGRGFGLLNIETLDMKLISTMRFNYGYGYNIVSELAVTNNGDAIAVMGMNAGLTVFENNDACGDSPSDKNMYAVLPISKACKKSPIQYGGFSYAVHPSFSEDGHELRFYTYPYGGGTQKVSLRVAGYSNVKLEYLALGDSYSSGEGENEDQYYLEGTNDEYEKCHVSSRSYPFLIAGFSDLNPDLVKSVACSGATTKDVVGSDVYYLGQNDRLGNNGRKLNDVDLIFAQSESIDYFLPGRVHQASFINIYQPKVVTIGIGGNDIGVIDKLKTCISPGTCNWASDPAKREQVAIEIKNLFGTLVNTYQELHDSSPNSKIYAVGYSRLVDTGESCGLLTGFLLDSVERNFMSETGIYLNQVIKAAAGKVGIGYLDIQESYGQNVMCGAKTPSAVNSIVMGDDFGLSGQSSWIKFIGNESFHPNPYGHQLTANYIFNSVGNISEHNYCLNGLTICPNPVGAPEPSSYWVSTNYHDYPSLKLAEFVYDREDSTNNLQKQVVLSNFSVLPNSTVEVEINSTATSLGIFVSDSYGALNFNVDLPENLEEGFHTVHIYAKSYSGEKVDLYQVIKYQKIVENVPVEENKIIEPSDNIEDLVDIKDLDVVKVSSNEITRNIADQPTINSGEQISYSESTSLIKNNLSLETIINKPEVLGESINNTDKEENTKPSYENKAPNNYIFVILAVLTLSIFAIVSLVTIKKFKK